MLKLKKAPSGAFFLELVSSSYLAEIPDRALLVRNVGEKGLVAGRWRKRACRGRSELVGSDVLNSPLRRPELDSGPFSDSLVLLV
jgi:hypothetical protein